MKDDFDVFIDFTRPEGTLSHLAFCRQHGKGMVIGTTGFDEAGKQAIQDASHEIAIVFAATFSVGVNVMLKLLEKAVKVMGELYRHWDCGSSPPLQSRCSLRHGAGNGRSDCVCTG